MYVCLLINLANNKGYYLIAAGIDIVNHTNTYFVNQNGDGSADYPFEISDVQDLQTLQNNTSLWNYNYIQTNNLNCLDTTWTPIGNSATPFTGNYDGQGYTISFSNISTIAINEFYSGFWGYINGSLIQRLHIDWLNGVKSNKYNVCLGGIVGYAKYATIKNCYVTGTELYGDSTFVAIVGGIVGSSYGAKVINCYNTCSVDGSHTDRGPGNYVQLGGIIASAGTIINCFNLNSGNIGGGDAESGGVVVDDPDINNLQTITTSYHNSSSDEAETYINDLENLVKYSTNFGSSGQLNWDASYPWDFSKIWQIISEGNSFPTLQEVKPGYTITYNAGSGTGNPYTTPIINSGTSASILNVTDSNLNYTKLGYHFVNWSGSDGGTYTAGQSHTFSANVTLTAQWAPNVYTIHFNSNAPSGAISIGASSMSSQQFTYGVAQTLTPNAFDYKYYIFKGWATNSGGGVTYADKADLSNLTTLGNGGSMTLYAVWEKVTSTTTLSINFNKPTNSGVFIYILDGTQSSGTMMQQMYISSTQSVKLELEKTHTYTIIVSKPYTWGITFSGGGTINGTAYTFTTSSATSGSTHTITLTGGSTINGSIIV